jgi:GDP-L-fucose synthase
MACRSCCSWAAAAFTPAWPAAHGRVALLTGTLEPTNEPYAIAKIAGIKLCESYNRQYGRDYRSVMPTNLYGPGDNYHPENSHVIPRSSAASMRPRSAAHPGGHLGHRHAQARVPVCGRHGRASVFVMNLPKATYQANTTPMCKATSMWALAATSPLPRWPRPSARPWATRAITFDATKPDGAPRKWMDSSRLNAWAGSPPSPCSRAWPGADLCQILALIAPTYLAQFR